MDRQTIEKYGPIALVVIALLIQWNVFVTPEKLEVKHREILEEVADKYTTKEMSNQFNLKLDDMQHKIDRIYDKIISNK